MPNPMLTPKYYQVKQEIMRDIVSNGMQVGSVFPSGREIARKYGVAYNTARRAINELEQDGIIRRRAESMALVARIPELMQESGHEQSRTVKNIMIFVQTRIFGQNEDFEIGVYRSLETLLKQKDWNILLQPLSRNTDPQKIVADQAHAKLIDGVIASTIYYEDVIRRIHASGLPTIVIDYTPQTVHLDCVVTNNYRIIQQAIDHLLSRGHRRIWYLGHYHDEDMVKDFDAEEMEFHWRRLSGIFRFTGESHFSITNDINDYIDHHLINAMKRKKPPTALIVSNPGMTRLLCDRLKERGFNIPDDISIISLGDETNRNLRISAVRIDWFEIARIAVERLSDLMEGTAKPGARFSYAGTFVDRGTTRSIDP